MKIIYTKVVKRHVLWKRYSPEETKPLLWSKNWEMRYILEVYEETIFVKSLQNKMKESTNNNEAKVCPLKRKKLGNF